MDDGIEDAGSNESIGWKREKKNNQILSLRVWMVKEIPKRNLNL